MFQEVVAVGGHLLDFPNLILLCMLHGVARASGGHLLNFANQIYADFPCVGDVALHELASAIF